METIKNYLDTMFANLPKTTEIMKLKEDLQNNMEDKYNELKQNGKSVNEAVGIVISEFGNIDELVRELNIEMTNPYSESLPVITREEADHIVYTKRTYGNVIACGVFLCIIAPALYFLISTGMEAKGHEDSALSLACLLVPVAIAVGMFIFSGMQLDKFNYLKEPFVLDYKVADFINKKKFAYQASYTAQIIIGVMLCILSALLAVGVPAFNIAFSSGISVFLFFTVIAVAVFLFIHCGCIMDSYHELLQENDYAKKSKMSNKIVEAVGAVVWPITIIIYFLYSFSTERWNISWILLAVVGILFGSFSAACNIMMGTKKS